MAVLGQKHGLIIFPVQHVVNQATNDTKIKLAGDLLESLW